MDFLRKLLGVLLFILVVVVGAAFYVTGGNPFAHTGLEHDTSQSAQNKTSENQMPMPGDQSQVQGKQNQQKVNVILQPDLKAYIDQINQGISLINEANGLITADSFFTDPPRVTLGKAAATPTDKEVPKERNLPLVVLPDGTYQIIGYGQGDMEQAHRGIYKLGQGMTILNTVLDRMNQDIKDNNFPLYGSSQNMSGMNGMGYDQNMSGMYGAGYNQNMYGTGMGSQYGMYGSSQGMTHTPGMTNVPGMTTIGTGTTGLLSGGTVSNVIGIILIGFVILIFVAIFGYILSIFKEGKSEV